MSFVICHLLFGNWGLGIGNWELGVECGVWDSSTYWQDASSTYLIPKKDGKHN
ncbi:MAG: hypothetical protein F6K47_01625 [Symploca sp. SIO2E6]|nr:hypothetical protein [Symploca sp. SIO2E6]